MYSLFKLKVIKALGALLSPIALSVDQFRFHSLINTVCKPSLYHPLGTYIHPFDHFQSLFQSQILRTTVSEEMYRLPLA